MCAKVSVIVILSGPNDGIPAYILKPVQIN